MKKGPLNHLTQSPRFVCIEKFVEEKLIMFLGIYPNLLMGSLSENNDYI